LRAKYGLHDEVDLGDEDVEDGRAKWEAGRERRGLPVEDAVFAEGSTAGAVGTPSAPRRNGKGRATDGASVSLAQVLRKSTKRKYDPFAEAADLFLAVPRPALPREIAGLPKRGRIKETEGMAATPAKIVIQEKIGRPSMTLGVLAGYASD
jgi:coiled-coil domain-containing protein 130